MYKDRDIQAFLSKFLSGELEELVPSYDPKLGYRYPIVEAIVGDASNTEAFLNKLSEAGILEKELHDKVIYCPKCNSNNISIRYNCPYCGSFNIERSALIEHVKCGYMDVEENFKKGNILVCPKCREELKRPDVDYRKAGMWCSCNVCDKSFDIPVAGHFCRDCHAKFTFEDAVIKDSYVYRLVDEVREEASTGWILIAPIREFLIENGFQVESPAFLKGKSGANHMFDIAAFKGEDKRKTTVIDVAMFTENAASEQPVIALFAKVFDVSPDNSFLIAIPNMSENGKKMAELYNIQIIEAKNQKEASKALAGAMLKK